MEEEEEEVEVVQEEVIDTWDEWEREEEVKLETLIEEFEAQFEEDDDDRSVVPRVEIVNISTLGKIKNPYTYFFHD